MDKEVALGVKLFVHLKCVCQKIVEFEFVESWIKNRCKNGILIELVYKSVNQRGFPCTDIPHEKQESPVVRYTVFQNGKCFFVGLTKPEKFWIRTDLKRFFF